ncbi:SAM-dependent methyltransferase [Rubinisphaera sp.]|uniref:class I SAM-dependent methyltransferase n=1 Tax=Rubinisphaera sp. TaxID=2024857 RepID=UPI000C0D06B2|nr:SAM-dependent methyltransferase [Rubinisphaera sp.]MBV08608.1 SAM-dependent methyltransferase [Rubinisphaera sp.]|tara:strand:- start:264 stop:1463 length:1200 start_codon:yes stop_codon:yes gene_type:complete
MTLAELWSVLTENYERGDLVSIALSGPVSKKNQEFQRIMLRPIALRDEIVIQWTMQDRAKKQTHQNRDWKETGEHFETVLGSQFLNALVRLTSEDLQVRVQKNGSLKVQHHRSTKAAPQLPLTHNTKKQYLFSEGEPIPFLVELGVMTPNGRVHRSMQRKFRQINRFAEFIADLREKLPRDRPVRIVDYGCGKSYLTFAIRELLVNHFQLAVQIQAFDSQPGVIETCEKTRQKLGINDMQFEVASIQDARIEGPIDLAIWLHACDTATDDALARSLELGAEIILAVPCCQHELHHQLENEALAPLLKHGILRERLASLATDALRAQYLEILGYRTHVIEFIDLEHTAKNLLIRAIKSEISPTQQAAARLAFQELKSSLGVKSFHLETICKTTNGSISSY